MLFNMWLALNFHQWETVDVTAVQQQTWARNIQLLDHTDHLVQQHTDMMSVFAGANVSTMLIAYFFPAQELPLSCWSAVLLYGLQRRIKQKHSMDVTFINLTLLLHRGVRVSVEAQRTCICNVPNGVPWYSCIFHVPLIFKEYVCLHICWLCTTSVSYLCQCAHDIKSNNLICILFAFVSCMHIFSCKRYVWIHVWAQWRSHSKLTGNIDPCHFTGITVLGSWMISIFVVYTGSICGASCIKRNLGKASRKY